MKYQIVFVIYDKILKDCIFLLTDNYHNQQNLYIYQDRRIFNMTTKQKITQIRKKIYVNVNLIFISILPHASAF